MDDNENNDNVKGRGKLLDSTRLQNLLLSLLIVVVGWQTTRIISKQDILIEGQARSDLNDALHNQRFAVIEQNQDKQDQRLSKIEQLIGWPRK